MKLLESALYSESPGTEVRTVSLTVCARSILQIMDLTDTRDWKASQVRKTLAQLALLLMDVAAFSRVMPKANAYGCTI